MPATGKMPSCCSDGCLDVEVSLRTTEITLQIFHDRVRADTIHSGTVGKSRDFQETLKGGVSFQGNKGGKQRKHPN